MGGAPLEMDGAPHHLSNLMVSPSFPGKGMRRTAEVLVSGLTLLQKEKQKFLHGHMKNSCANYSQVANFTDSVQHLLICFSKGNLFFPLFPNSWRPACKSLPRTT